jgi:hypothetical protein
MATIFWNTGVSGNWSQASNWSSGTVPNGGDTMTKSMQRVLIRLPPTEPIV